MAAKAPLRVMGYGLFGLVELAQWLNGRAVVERPWSGSK